jgi:hypothetical protein
MPILLRDLKWRGSAVMADSDATTNIGGALDMTKKPQFADLSGSVQVVSDSAADTAVLCTITYLDAGGTLLSESKTVNGLTPVTFSATIERLMKAVLSGSGATGNIALELQTADRSGTVTSGDADSVTLDGGASAANQAYRQYVLRILSGPASGTIREIIDYNGTSKKALVGQAMAAPASGTSTYRVSRGMYFDLTPTGVVEIRRLAFNAAADVPGGTNREYYDKIFVRNMHATLTGTVAKVGEAGDTTGVMTFGLAAAKNDTGDNGPNNRQIAPAGVTFDNADKNIPGTTLEAGSAIGVWTKYALPAGAAAVKGTWSPKVQLTTT